VSASLVSAPLDGVRRLSYSCLMHATETTDTARFTVNAAHSGRTFLTRAPFAEVAALLSAANIDATLARTLDPGATVDLGRGAYRIVRVA
jgi:hypothetical protein